MQLQLPIKEAGRVDPDEAPAGYYATPKVCAGENICRQCDWRAQCNDESTNLLAYGHRCMGYAVVVDGKTHQRQDGCSVVFKRRLT